MIRTFHHPDLFAGWHVGFASPTSTPGTLNVFATRGEGRLVHCVEGYVRADVLRVAIETGIIAKPNGRTMPSRHARHLRGDLRGRVNTLP